MGHDIIKYNDYLIVEDIQFIDSLPLNESLESVKSYLSKVFQRIKNVSIERKKTILIYALTSLLMFTNTDKILSVIGTDNFMKSELVANPELGKLLKDKLEKSPFKDATTLKVSKKGWESVKQEEGDPRNPGDPVLKAYMIGDGMITVGWGHAEPVSKSKFKVGQVITRDEATKLLKEDLKEAADGVRKIFKQWKDDGIERKITQDQFDALVSMCFNMGAGGLRRSEVISLIKKGDYEGAGERIKTQSVSKKFSGLKKRRKREADLFLSYLDKKDLPVKNES